MFLGASDPTSQATFLTHFLAIYFMYTDPGYGTLIWQLLLAGFFGGMFYFRRLKDFLSRRKRPENGEQ
jgi:hypothetical protein